MSVRQIYNSHFMWFCLCGRFEFYSVMPPRCVRKICPWDSSGKNTGVGCHFLLQGIFPTQGSNPWLLHYLHWHVGSLPLGSPWKYHWLALHNRHLSHSVLEAGKSKIKVSANSMPSDIPLPGLQTVSDLLLHDVERDHLSGISANKDINLIMRVGP